jgi:hypothetical protein
MAVRMPVTWDMKKSFRTQIASATNLQLGPHRGFAGTSVASQDLGRQRHGASLGQSATVKGYFARGIASLGPEMMPVDRLQLAPCDHAQPQEEGHFGITEIFCQRAREFQIRFLQNIGGIETALQPPVKTQLHHPLQAVSVPAPKLP